MNYRLSIAFILVAVLIGAGSAGAVDGTIDINQAKILAAGGYPYSISSSGSYRLTGNLTVPTVTNAIQLGGNSNITIDLNGFSITGAGTSGGTGIGSFASSKNVTIKNGVITNFSVGVFIGSDSTVENVIANSNLDGILVTDRSKVRNCTTNFGADGMRCNSSSACTFTGNTIVSNTGDGIVCGNGNCLISGNTIVSNGEWGILCSGSACLILDNVINNNTSTGILANDATTSYGNNVLNGNGTNISGGTSLGGANTNLCNGTRC